MHADFDDSDNAEDLARRLSDQKGEPIRYERIEQRELDALSSGPRAQTRGLARPLSPAVGSSGRAR
jgi:hypothetical protein